MSGIFRLILVFLAARAVQVRIVSLLFGAALSSDLLAAELATLLQNVLQHPQIQAASIQTEAARAQKDAASARYFGSAMLSAGWHRYEDRRIVGVYTPGTSMLPLSSERIVQSGLNYTLPVDLSGVIAANQERAQHDLRASHLLARQQTLLKLHQATNAYIALQGLLKQRAALTLSRQRVDATYQRTNKEFELGKAAGVDVRYAESELARLNADEAVLDGALAQAQADIAEASGQNGFLPAAATIRIPSWRVPADDALPVQIAQARQQSAQALAEESRRALHPAITLDANFFRNSAPGDGHRNTWVVGAVLSLPLGVSQYRQASAHKLAAAAAAEQSEAARRDAGRQFASLSAAYDSALADAASLAKEVRYREEVAQIQQNMQRLGNQTLENLFRHERDLRDARYRLAQAEGRAATAWSAAQVVIGLPVDSYIAQIDPT
ncbi:MAG: TolC family protein [Telluria sp.]|nr:TolC family protein [Telluria sp.]